MKLTAEQIVERAREDCSRNFDPFLPPELNGDKGAFYLAERRKAEIAKARGAGRDHAAYMWARSHYADAELQVAYNEGYAAQLKAENRTH